MNKDCRTSELERLLFFEISLPMLFVWQRQMVKCVSDQADVAILDSLCEAPVASLATNCLVVSLRRYVQY